VISDNPMGEWLEGKGMYCSKVGENSNILSWT